MLNKTDIEYIIEKLPNDDSTEGKKVKTKLDLIYQQITLQEDFRERSLELQKKQAELDK